MELKSINEIKPEAWDEAISEFDSQLLFHRSCWLKFLEETQPGEPLRFKIIDDGKVAGYFVGLLIKKGFLRIFGSPLSKWETDTMGPVCNDNFDVEEFLEVLDRMCKKLKIHHIEIGNPIFIPAMMKRRGYSCLEWKSYVIPLSNDLEKMWKNLKSKCRNRIRKGLKNGLVAEDYDNIKFVEEHYRQLIDVYSKQGRIPTFSADMYRSLFRHLKSENLLFTLQVKQGDQVVASGIFPHDERNVCSLSTASYRKYQKLIPNELLIWKVMCFAAERGIRNFNIGDNYRTIEGSGRFKDKFNGLPVINYRYYKNYTIWAKVGREVYKKVFYVKQKIRDKLYSSIKN
jgi:hypothetical protein